MKKKLCKTLRTMANKLPELKPIKYSGERYTDYTVQPSHYRRLKRLLVKGGTQAVKIYFDKHKAA